MHPALRRYVTAVTAYDVDLGEPGVHRGLPSTTLTFVLPWGAPLDVGWVDEPGSRALRWSAVSGLHDRPAAIHHDGVQRGVQIGLSVEGARALLGVPAAALAGQLAELEEVCPELRHLPERLAEVELEQAGTVVEEALMSALARSEAPGPRSEVGHALRRLTCGDAVHSVADQIGYSRRRLTTLVRDECGLGPKTYQRLARFEASRGLLGRTPLASVAAACGYADQAHLTREWTDLAGCPPTTWLREEFPFLQDLTGANGKTGPHERRRDPDVGDPEVP